MHGRLPVFWKTSVNIVLPAPLFMPVVVVFSRLVAHAGSADPAAERGSEVPVGVAELPEPPVPPEAPEDAAGDDAEPEVEPDTVAGTDGVDETDAGPDVEDDAEALDEPSDDPHAASASPAPTSSTAGTPRRTFLIRMVALFPECSQRRLGRHSPSCPPAAHP